MKNPQLQRKLFDKLEGSRWSGDERYFSCYCPFEEHQKPAFLCYDDGYTCLSCGVSGSIVYLERTLSKGTVNFIHPKKSSLKPILPRWKSWQNRYGEIPEIAWNAHRMAKEYDTVSYFKKRKIYQFFERGMFGKLDGWYTFPVMNEQHEIIDLVVRAGEGKKDAGAKYVISPECDGDRPLYVPNWERVRNSDSIWVVFGIVTAWAMEDLGLPCVTGITGKALNPELLQDFHKQIIVIPDYDEDEAGAKLVNSLGWRGKLKLMDFPEKCTDLDDVRVRFGNETLMQMIGA